MNSYKLDTVAGLGNAIVDVLSYVEEETLERLGLQKGSMQLCSEDFQKIVLNETTSHEILPGGSVANSIATLSDLEVPASFSGTIGSDIWGDAFKKSLLISGVDLNLKISQEQPTGKSIVLITPDGERTMNTCLGASENNSENFFVKNSVSKSDYIFVEGYLLDSDEAWSNIVSALPTLKANNTKIILTLSDAFCVESNLLRFTLLVEQSSIVFANSKEISALWLVEESTLDFNSPLPDPKPYTLVVTRSEYGATIFSSDKVATSFAKTVTNICDLTGAGDQFAAGYIYGTLQNWDIMDCAKFGNQLASKIITRIGPRFKNNETQSILDEFTNINNLPKKVPNVH